MLLKYNNRLQVCTAEALVVYSSEAISVFVNTMPRREEKHREGFVAAHQPRKDYKTISPRYGF